MSQISTRNLDALPDVEHLLALLQSLATLDAIMSPNDWDARYYSFNSKWSRAEQMGSMRNGSGDEFYALFNCAGCFIKGFAHESATSLFKSQLSQLWPGMLSDLPADFLSGLNEPAFSMSEATFCIWRLFTDESWSHGPISFTDGDDPDGSAYLLGILDGQPKTYCQFAEDYWESTLPFESVLHVYNHLPITESIVSSLNAETDLRAISNDLAEIGYPILKAK